MVLSAQAQRDINLADNGHLPNENLYRQGAAIFVNTAVTSDHLSGSKMHQPKQLL